MNLSLTTKTAIGLSGGLVLGYCLGARRERKAVMSEAKMKLHLAQAHYDFLVWVNDSLASNQLDHESFMREMQEKHQFVLSLGQSL